MVTVTALAATKLKDIMSQQGDPQAALRIAVAPNGDGVAYQLGLVKEVENDDVVVTSEDIRVIMDPTSAPMLDGVVVDYIETFSRAGFVISNPNVASTCACGGSGQCGCGHAH